jgi:hypothetical protein
MTTSVFNEGTQLRLVENWLPFAQDANMQYIWGYDAPSLERLVLKAAPALSQARSWAEARVILWHYHVWNKMGKL